MSRQEADTQGLQRLWRASAWLFVLGALSGVVFRWGMMAGFPEGLVPHYLRHGHSHLMLMGWATPALMALMAAKWPELGGRQADRPALILGWSAWATALLSFPPFIAFGYSSVAIGSANLPLAAMISGVAFFIWYGFAALYFWAHRGVKRSPALRLWDIALVALVISSLGAWAVAGLMMAKVDNPFYESAVIHFFVDLFGTGWLMIGILGLIRAEAPAQAAANERVGRWLIAAALPFVFLVGLPRSQAPEVLILIGNAAAGALAAGLLLNLQTLWDQVDPWLKRVLLFLGLQCGALALMAIPPVANWGLSGGLRIFYLHLTFVGAVTLGLVVSAWRFWPKKAVHTPEPWLGAVLILLATMIPLTKLWPQQLAGRWVLYLAFGGALAATILALFACLQVWFIGLKQRKTHHPSELAHKMHTRQT